MFVKPNYKSIENIDPLLYTGINIDKLNEYKICDNIDSKTGKCNKKNLITVLKNKYKDEGLFKGLSTSNNNELNELKNMLKYSNYTKALCNNQKSGQTENLYGKLPYFYNDDNNDGTIDAMLNTTNKEIKEITNYINENDYSKDASDSSKITSEKCRKFYGAYCEILKGNLKELLGEDYNNESLNQYDTNCACYADLLKDVSPDEFNMLIKSDKTGELKKALNNRTCALQGCNKDKYTPSQTYEDCTAKAITICTNNVNIGGIDVSDGGKLGEMKIANDCTASSSVSENNNTNINNNNNDNNDNNNNNDNDNDDNNNNDNNKKNKEPDYIIDNDNNNNLILYGSIGVGSCCCLVCCVIIAILLLKKK